MKFKIKVNKQNLFILFAYMVVFLLVVKACSDESSYEAEKISTSNTSGNTIKQHAQHIDSLLLRKRPQLVLFDTEGQPVKNRITSVSSFKKAFPDLNDVQLATASCIGVEKIRDRKEATEHIDKLVFIDDNPYFSVRTLKHSIPYLTPHAASLLNAVARAFIDSLSTKGLPLHKIEVTSVLRTESDITKLQRVNVNASKASCHRHGTTFDIGYNRFIRVDKDKDKKMENGIALKSVLAEVLNDFREMGACYVKYERKQACFHITAR